MRLRDVAGLHRFSQAALMCSQHAIVA